jgi:hypothetical protein
MAFPKENGRYADASSYTKREIYGLKGIYVLRSVTFDAYSYFRIELLTLNDVPLPI